MKFSTGFFALNSIARVAEGRILIHGCQDEKDNLLGTTTSVLKINQLNFNFKSTGGAQTTALKGFSR